ncbi:protein-lysine N-methyltransferase Ecym_2195 [Eremothecium cymbalariae DBVPG|uniref:SET domain-containing protein n=1 Tax=Eremothecium cymbalariae (strain CBS 270.75 / DBVPG 7215 / KCTC 17166 / NRRL Y-17582) TaxID=931890 RepID=G8JP39_ERECY|nr:Hypothetical protein Ecym_2195 [Eremothecium cymbalariae DBVPG\
MLRDRLGELLEWGVSNGVQLPTGVEFRTCEEKGIVVVASERVEEAEFKLPAELILTSRLAEKHFSRHDNPNIWFKALVAKMKFSKEAVMVGDKDIALYFGKYMNCLPEEVDSPLIWKPDELELLDGTNIGGSISEKLDLIVNDWRYVINELGFDVPQAVQEQLVFAARMLAEPNDVSKDEIYNMLIKHPKDGEPHWLSFQAFIWSHLIFTSRAFPERILNSTCEISNVILLPILDLLNHSQHSKIEWAGDNGVFSFRKLEPVEVGDEIFNNYGGKSNEELLVGYGFVIEDNKCDYLALKIKPPFPVLKSMLKAGLSLPILDDYTTFAFDTSIEKNNTTDISRYSDGILYLINKHNDQLLWDLLSVYSFLEAGDEEDHNSLRCQLQGIQNLRESIEQRLKTTNVAPRCRASDSLKYQILSRRARYAEVYRQQQVQILKYSIQRLKDLEKDLVKSNKDKLLTFKSISHLDNDFLETILPALFESETEFENYDEVMILWVVLRSKTSPSLANGKFNSILEAYKSFRNATSATDFIKIQDSEDWNIAKTKYLTWFPNGTDHFSLEDLYFAFDFFTRHTYFRPSKSESIIVLGD